MAALTAEMEAVLVSVVPAPLRSSVSRVLVEVGFVSVVAANAWELQTVTTAAYYKY